MRSWSLLCAVIGVVAIGGACSGDDGGNPFGSGTTGTESTSPSTTEPTSTVTSDTGTTSTTTDDTGSSTTSVGTGTLCGDGVIAGDEECDCGDDDACTAAELDDKTCEDFESPGIGNFTGGTLACNPASCRFDQAACVFCGDGMPNGNEDCEDDSPITDTCESLGLGVLGDVTCGADCLYDTSTCTYCIFHWDWEDPNECDGWTTGLAHMSSAASTWECGDPGTYTGGPGTLLKGMWATGLDGAYNNNESSYVASPTLDLTTCEGQDLEVTVHHWHDFEGDFLNYDGSLMQVSEDDGQTWTTIAPDSGDGYFNNQNLVATYPPVNGVKGFSGKDGNRFWKTSVWSLDDQQGMDDVKIRFVFGSNGSVTDGGWYINTIDIVETN